MKCTRLLVADVTPNVNNECGTTLCVDYPRNRPNIYTTSAIMQPINITKRSKAGMQDIAFEYAKFPEELITTPIYIEYPDVAPTSPWSLNSRIPRNVGNILNQTMLSPTPQSGPTLKRATSDTDQILDKRLKYQLSAIIDTGALKETKCLIPFQPDISLFEIDPRSIRPAPTLAKLSAATKQATNSAEIITAKTKSLHQVGEVILSDNGKRGWELIRLIGKGGCGEVFLAKEINVSSDFVALKFIKVRKQFLSEWDTMKRLSNHLFGNGTLIANQGRTPKLVAVCRKSKGIVMEYLPDTIAHRFEKCKMKFSLKTILMVAIDMVIILDAA